MDGLMLDTEALGLWAWQRAVQDFGLFLPEEVFHQMVGLSRSESDQVLITYFGSGFQLERARERRIAYGKEYLQKNGMQVKPGLLSLLEFLDENNIPRAVATSTVREVTLERLKAAGLTDRFEHIVTGDEVAQSKPAPDIFLLAANRLGISAAKCIVIEDSENGIRAAHRAEMTVIMVPDLKAPSEEIRQLTFAVCKDLNEVRSVLEQHYGTSRTSSI